MSPSNSPGLFKKFKTFIRLNLEKMGLYPVRADFLEILPKNGVGAELGVFQGKFSVALLERTSPQKLHLIDPWWKASGETYGDWSRFHNNGELLPTRQAYQQAQDHVAATANGAAAEFHVDDDVAVLKSFSDHSLDWAYVDSTHLYEHTVAELEELQRVIKPDGVIAGHDWYPDPANRHHGVYKAVMEFCDRYQWEIVRIDPRFTQWAIKRK